MALLSPACSSNCILCIVFYVLYAMYCILCYVFCKLCFVHCFPWIVTLIFITDELTDQPLLSGITSKKERNNNKTVASALPALPKGRARLFLGLKAYDYKFPSTFNFYWGLHKWYDIMTHIMCRKCEHPHRK